MFQKVYLQTMWLWQGLKWGPAGRAAAHRANYPQLEKVAGEPQGPSLSPLTLWLQICSQIPSSSKHLAPLPPGESQGRPDCLCDLADTVIQNRQVEVQSKALLPSLFQYIPMPVLYGVFLYMGVASLNGIQVRLSPPQTDWM